jgi:hypothetical protein
MRDLMILAAAGIGGILLAFGNDLGFLGLIPAIVLTVKDVKKV